MSLLSRPVLASLVLIVLLFSALPYGSAGTRDDPEMPDKVGDVDPLSLVGLKPDELDVIQSNLSMFDIKAAWVTAENRNGFWFVIEVVDLQGGLTPPDPTVPVPPMLATFEIYFETEAGPWIARAEIEPWHYIDPPIVFVTWIANFTLHHDDDDQTLVAQTPGAVHGPTNGVYFYIPKGLVGEPTVGTEMTQMYAVSRFQHHVLDFAPDAAVDPTKIDPLTFKPNDPLRLLFTPGFGRNYEFGQFPGSGAPSRLEIEAIGETSVTIEKGASADLSVRVKNIGNTAQTIRFGSTTPSGWAVTLDPVEMTLQPGSSDALIITAVPGEKARSPGVLRVSASTPMETQTLIFALQTPIEAGSGSSVGGTPSGRGSPGQSLEDSTSKGAPALGVPVLLVALAGLGATLRRRQ